MEDRIKYFEDNYHLISKIIEQFRGRWKLAGIQHYDFDDAKNEIANHIYLKLHLYNTEYNFSAWIASIVNNQFKNLLRNKYYNVAKPCVSCVFKDEDCCIKYGVQGPECPLFKKWLETKQDKFNVNFTVTMENHTDEVNGISDPVDNIEDSLLDFKDRMKEELSHNEYIFFNLVYLQNKTEKEAGKVMGYKTNKEAVANLKFVKNNVLEKARKILGGIDEI